MAFNLDSNIFFQGAGLKQRQQENFLDAISKGIANYQKGQELDVKRRQLEGLDVKNLADQGYINKQRGLEVTPEQQAAMRYVDAQNMSKTTVDRYGNIVRNDSVYDMMFGQPEQPQPAGFDFNQFQSPEQKPEPVEAPRITNRAEEMAYQQKLDLEKEQIKEKRDLEKKIKQDTQEKKQQANETLPLVDEMIQLNKGTWQIPYAGALQPITRMTDQDAAEDMAQLKQLRLRIAAPLAKQLGVNPTDKDFQNTLDQIFNDNESGKTRDKQLGLLKSIFEGNMDAAKQSGFNNKGKSPKFPRSYEGKRIRNKSTGEIGIIKNGQWVKE